mmetsp:Transcript_26475/g.62193  ORF Transcript_26475/g.62193 Transcript_26475/m.62193 type:complete len:201 (+) Transcript_26475:93-695(+)
MTDPVTVLRNLNKLRTEGTGDKLRWVVGIVGLIVNHVCDSLAVSRIESLVEFVEDVERSRIAPLDREDESHGNKCLLPSTQLAHDEVFSHGRKSYLDADSTIETHIGVVQVFLSDNNVVAAVLSIFFSLKRFVYGCSHDEFTGPEWYEFLEYFCKMLAHSPKRAVDSFVLLSIKTFYQFLYFFGSFVQFAFAFHQGLPLL